MFSSLLNPIGLLTYFAYICGMALYATHLNYEWQSRNDFLVKGCQLSSGKVIIEPSSNHFFFNVD